MIILTDIAKDKIDNLLQNRNKGVGIRLKVETTGCSGLGYKIEFADKINKDDKVFTYNNFKILVDSKSFIYLDGTEIDYKKEKLSEGFEFNNPNAKAKCGCGESFTV